jgi:hypothetical protein
MLRKVLFAVLSAICCLAPALVRAQTPYINAAVADTEFHRISSADMDVLRTKKILFYSRSFGLNLYNGLVSLAAKNSMYTINAAYKRYDIFNAGGDLSVIPENAFENYNFVHVMCTPSPATARLSEFDDLLRNFPHYFADRADFAMMDLLSSEPATFAPYSATMDSLQANFPHIKFIYVTAGFEGPSQVSLNNASAQFSTMVRAKYKGHAPLFDWGFMLNNDSACGDHYCPEYSTDPADVHPNTEFAQERVAKGFLLMLYKMFREGQPACGNTDPPSVPTGLAGQGLSLNQTRLSWQPATHAACGVDYYRIRRDGADAGISYGLTYSDHSLVENTQYSYQVAAVSKGAVASSYCPAIQVRTFNDSIAPVIVSVPNTITGTEVTVYYSEFVDSATALNPANYAVSNGVTVQAARYFAEDSIVVLTTSALPPNVTCTLTVNGVTDRSRNHNAIAVNTKQTFKYSAMSLTGNLLAYWAFDGNAQDGSGHNLNGTWTGTASYGTGRVGQGLNLDGTNTGGYITVAENALLKGMAQLTMGIWAKKKSAASGGKFFHKHVTYYLDQTGTSLSGYVFNGTGARVNMSATVSAANDTNWHHYCFVYDGATIKSYVDGVQRNAVAQTGSIASSYSTSLYIGKDPWGNSFNGYLDELRMYDWAVDSSSISQMMALGLGNADSLAVRALLDANSSTRTVDGVSVFNGNRRITHLYLQTDLGGQISSITSHVGQLTELQVLHAYGPANHDHATTKLQTVDPAIANCRHLKDLLLNDNDLTTLPAGITVLDSLTSFSAGNNQLCGITGGLSTWLTQNDPDWAATQYCTGVKPDRTAVIVPAPFSIRQAADHITIARGTLTGVLTADFITTRGQLVYSIQGCPGDQMQWRTNSAKSGIYFVRVTNGLTTHVQKLVIVR